MIGASGVLEKGALIYLVALPLMFTETLLRPHFPGMQNLVWDWANFTLYLALVFYGFVFAANNRILDNIYRIRLFSLCFGTVLFGVAVAWRTSGVARSLGPAFPAYSVLMVFSWMFAVMGYARQFLNRGSGLYAYLEQGSLPRLCFPSPAHYDNSLPHRAKRHEPVAQVWGDSRLDLSCSLRHVRVRAENTHPATLFAIKAQRKGA